MTDAHHQVTDLNRAVLKAEPIGEAPAKKTIIDDGKPLLAVIQENDLDSMRDLIGRGRVDPNTVDAQCMTALHYAAEYRRAKMIAMLIESGANLSIVNKDGVTALEIARAKRFPKCVALLEAAEIKATEEGQDKAEGAC